MCMVGRPSGIGLGTRGLHSCGSPKTAGPDQISCDVGFNSLIKRDSGR